MGRTSEMPVPLWYIRTKELDGGERGIVRPQIGEVHARKILLAEGGKLHRERKQRARVSIVNPRRTPTLNNMVAQVTPLLSPLLQVCIMGFYAEKRPLFLNHTT